jgi:FAD/FMN-containing dehydrogenase
MVLGLRELAADSVTDATALNALAARVRGDLLRPTDGGFDEARRVFNTMIDRRPAAIVRPADTDDIRRAVLFARERGLPLSVKGGGHNVAGSAVCDGGLTLDCSSLKRIEVDPRRRLAVAQPGLLLGEVDRATQAFGLATPLGTASITGIAGLTLGGGIGWLNGVYGLSCDNLLAADVVTADGELLRASDTENPDLFWAIRGGSGNFGIVTSFVYRLHPAGPLPVASIVFPPERSREALRRYDEFTRSCPDELSAVCNLATDDDGRTVVAVTGCWYGSQSGAERALRPLRESGPLIEAVVETIDYFAIQQIIDERFPAGRQHYWKSNFLPGITDEAIDVMLDFAARRPSPAHVHSGEGPSRAAIAMQHLHGAAARVAPAAMAFPHRHDHHDLLILSQWIDPADAARHVAWTREFFAAMRPFTERAVYVNGLGEGEEDRVREAYGSNYDRLAAIKARYDPENVFRSNQNVKPTA